MIVDEQKSLSFQAMGESCVVLMEELRQNKKWSAREAEAQLAFLEAQQARQAAGANPLAWYRDIRWRDGFMTYFRSTVTVIAVGGLVTLLSMKNAKMEIEDQIALWGQISQGMSGARNALMSLAKVTTLTMGSFLNKWIFAPIAAVCKAVGTWLYRQLPQIGKSLIQGIGSLLKTVGEAIASGVEKVVTTAAKAGTW